jgi:capsular exopolysaccharide synthesis family protein
MAESRIKNLNFQALLYPLRRHLALALAGATGVLLAVSILTLTMKSVYRASATLFVREKKEMPGQLFDFSEAFTQKYLIKDQVAILESRSLAESVIQQLLESPEKDSLAILGNGRPQVNRLRMLLGHWYGAVHTADAPKPMFDEMVKAFQLCIRVSYGRDTDLIELQAEAPAAWEAALVVNTWMDTYRTLDRSDTRGEVTQTKLFLETKLKDMEDKLSASEKALSNYQKQNKVMSLSQETEQLVTQLSSFESLYNQTRTDLEALSKEHDYLSGQLDSTRIHLMEEMVKLSNPVLEALRREMATIVAEKAAYEGQLLGAGYPTQNDPKLVQMENRLRGVKDQIVRETRKLLKSGLANINPLDRSESLITQILQNETSRASLLAKSEALKNILDEYAKRMAALPDKNLELARLERDVQVNNKIYVMLREKYEETRIQEAGHADWIRVVDRASPPSAPVRPNPRLNLMLGLFFAVLLGSAVAYAKEYLQATVRNGADCRAESLDVLGEIPLVRTRSTVRLFGRRRSPSDIKRIRAREILPGLLLPGHDQHLMETYRSIRTSVLLTRRTRKWSALLVTSPNPGDGKSTTVANLAILMARNGIRTLLIDGDLRKPVLDVLFTGSPRQVGLSSVLNKKAEWKDTLRETSVSNLFLMPAGPEVKNAPELLGAYRMAHIVEEAKKEFGIVLFDSTPLLPVTDAALLATLLDGVILVVRASCTKREELTRSIQTVNSVRGHLLGSIVTGVHRSDLSDYANYYRSNG